MRDLVLGDYAGKEFSLRCGEFQGVADFYITQKAAYMAAAIGADAQDPNVSKFLAAFSINQKAAEAQSIEIVQNEDSSFESYPPPTTSPQNERALENADAKAETAPVIGSRMEIGAGAASFVTPAQSNAFTASEVTRKVFIVSKPEPEYAEQARRNKTHGVIRLRALLTSSGAVTNVTALDHLPDGLTEKAARAVHRVKFIPAMKGGEFVSQWITVQYSFSIY
jgi:TonB family protein